MGFVYSGGRRFGKAPRVFQILEDGSVRIGVARNVVVFEETVRTFADINAFIAALSGTTPEPKRKLKRRVKKSANTSRKTPRKKSDAS